jgi:AmiR/NasT family two-component response regulator
MQATAALSQLKVVVVDDDLSTRLFLKDCLENECGHHVIGEAATGTEMVRTVLDLVPDVVVFDIHLPHIDGLEALRQIFQTRNVAAVAVTADRDQALVRRAMGERIQAYLVKPVEAHQMGPAIQVAWARFGETNSLNAENATLRQTLQSRKLIERAKGVLMKRFRWSEADAFRRLQRGAMNRRVAMVDLAQSVLNGDQVDLGQS